MLPRKRAGGGEVAVEGEGRPTCNATESLIKKHWIETAAAATGSPATTTAVNVNNNSSNSGNTSSNSNSGPSIMPQRNTASYNSMICCYSRFGCPDDAWRVLKEMMAC
ncbi:unnamed protein product [Linum trigynum]|uniref:Pentatricopeptide repeat-containing protein n=1 Tax=Linum trigynum TaxID=586398 RepID=A0AAV2FB44_9ROSI